MPIGPTSHSWRTLAGLTALVWTLAAPAAAGQAAATLGEWSSWDQTKQTAYSIYYLKSNALSLAEYQISSVADDPPPGFDPELQRSRALRWARQNTQSHRKCLARLLEEEAALGQDLLGKPSRACFGILWNQAG